jgi:hypothetical protein
MPVFYETGFSSGYDAGMARTRQVLHEFLAELMTEQRSGSAMTPDKRRYLRHSIDAITGVIARLPSPAADL